MFRLLLLAGVILARSQSPSSINTASPDCVNEPGWDWIVCPLPASTSCWSARGVVGIPERVHDGSFEIFLAWQPEPRSAYRAVAFDSSGKRYNLDGVGASSSNFSMQRFRYTDAVLHYDAVEAVGFEVLPPKGWAIQSAIAREQASSQGLQTLPLPVVGEPYPFELTTHDGHSLQGQQFHGQVLLIDCWATWCTPCMKKMPSLRTTYQEWHTQGLEVVGVNYDHDQGRFLDAVMELGLPWAQVLVPADKDSRRLWYGSSSIRSLPRFILLGRDGRVVADLQDPKRMFALLDSLMAQ